MSYQIRNPTLDAQTTMARQESELPYRLWLLLVLLKEAMVPVNERDPSKRGGEVDRRLTLAIGLQDPGPCLLSSSGVSGEIIQCPERKATLSLLRELIYSLKELAQLSIKAKLEADAQRAAHHIV